MSDGGNTAVHKRKLRNYLLDAPLQLKYMSWVVLLAAAVGLIAGFFIWRSQRALLEEAEQAVEARSKAAETSRELGSAVLSNELLKRFDDPAFVEQLNVESKKIDERFEQERQLIVEQRAKLGMRQRVALAALIVGVVLLVLGGAVFSIVLTHRVAGPVFRLKRMSGEITEGKLKVPVQGLRDGDELKDLFASFTAMIHALRARDTHAIERIDRVLAELERSGPASAVEELRALRREVQSRLDET